MTAKHLGTKIATSAQSIHQADGSSTLQVIGETRIIFTRDNRDFKFEGLVIENLDVEVLAGTPFMETNDVAVRPARREVIISDDIVYNYGSIPSKGPNPVARRAFVLRAPSPSKTIWPGEYLEINLPEDAEPDAEYAIEPRMDAPRVRRLKQTQLWPRPSVLSSVASKIRIPNLTSEPHTLKRNEHFCQVTPVFEPHRETTTTMQNRAKHFTHPPSKLIQTTCYLTKQS